MRVCFFVCCACSLSASVCVCVCVFVCVFVCLFVHLFCPHRWNVCVYVCMCVCVRSHLLYPRMERVIRGCVTSWDVLSARPCGSHRTAYKQIHKQAVNNRQGGIKAMKEN